MLCEIYLCGFTQHEKTTKTDNTSEIEDCFLSLLFGRHAGMPLLSRFPLLFFGLYALNVLFPVIDAVLLFFSSL